MVEVEAHHLGRPPCGAARLDRSRRAVADLEKGHEPRGLAAARQRLVLAAKPREIGAATGAVLEDAGLPGPEVHDPAVIDEIVGHGLDETRRRLRTLVGAARPRQRPRVGIDVVVPLGGAAEVVGVVQARVKPLWRVGRRDLARQHVADLFVEGPGIGWSIEVAVLLPPLGPAARHPVEDLPGIPLAPEHRPAVSVQERPAIRAELGYP